MANQTRTYRGVNQQAFDRIRASLATKGVVLPNQPTGSTTAQGYTISWAFDPSQAALSVTLDGGWLTMGFAWGKIEGLIAPCMVC